ncbi:MAG: ribonuclease E/G [Hyphomicrobiales bacterium]
MGSKMLIDATHPEETRVVVSRGDRIEEFDYESASRKQLKGNIYLAKVTRVEPSLQAAFVDYGGNRHGFLAFSEIHPDYYQIPVADRQALLQQEEEYAHREAEEENGDDADQEPSPPEPAQASSGPEPAGEQTTRQEAQRLTGSEETGSDERPSGEAVGGGIETVEEDSEGQRIESVGAEDALEEVPQRPRRPPRRNYKIQEVIKRRQVILVQVVKEERGNKGAALTTYLSLAGRYCVLMPNTARGGGISRKITDAGDRRRLKEVARDIEVPEGMGLIVRTAGAQRTKTEIKRDFDYLIRLWENVRDLTLSSQAPALVYEEGSLIKRAIRDLYTKDVEEVLVEGEDAYREAKDFMKMLMPSHARNVKLYKDARPLFSRHQVESQLDTLFSPTVTLQSGGYMVINQTEALVSIDINSGKATREHNIEDTAYKTNLEASDEIARQLRLRDLAGLIVIDFIDMEEKRNNRGVERRLKEALKHDRARIQVGRISHFGLLEMSRQRLRPGLLEGSTKVCPTCEGRGIVRSISSCALSVLRAIEENLISRKPENLTVKCHPEVAFYVLNEKRDHLLAIETNYGISIFLSPSHEVKSSQATIERGAERALPAKRPVAAPVMIDSAYSEVEAVEDVAASESEEIAEQSSGDAGEQRSGDDHEDGGRRRRRRRGRRGGRRGREGGEHGMERDRPSEVPGLGEQPMIDDDSEIEGAVDGEAPREVDADSEQSRGEHRDRHGRGRGRRDRGSRHERGERRQREDLSSVEDLSGSPSSPQAQVAEIRMVEAESIASPPPREPVEAEAAEAPAPSLRDADAPTRKWQPPSATVSEAPAQPKAGWWRRKTS